MTPVGDYYSWLKVELLRTVMQGGLASQIATGAVLLPAAAWFHLRRPTERSTNALCWGYHVYARLK